MSTGNKSSSRRDQDRRPSAGMMSTMGSFDEDDELFDGNSGDHKQVWLQFSLRQYLLVIYRAAIHVIDRSYC